MGRLAVSSIRGWPGLPTVSRTWGLATAARRNCCAPYADDNSLILSRDALSHVLEQRMQGAAEKDRHYATRVRQAAQQLDEYVAALLAHARLSHTSLAPRSVDLSAMAQAVLDDLRVREPDRAVATAVEGGLSAVGDPTLLRMVLENLLGNAWKFTKERPDARIRFNADGHAEGFTTFCVTDNGAGFDMDYAHKLFGAFERLHTQAEFPGTGIGLANVKRIVLRHGGRVFATGAPGAGASFCFTLPRVRAEAGPHALEVADIGSTRNDH